MRIAIVSDIHGNLTALDAVLADLRRQKPDVIYHGGDLPYGGSDPAEVIDCIVQEGWQGVLGNTDEMLWDTPARSALELQRRSSSRYLKCCLICAARRRPRSLAHRAWLGYAHCPLS